MKSINSKLVNIQDTPGCEGWTWTDEDNTALHNGCLLYSAFGETISYPHCVRYVEVHSNHINIKSSNGVCSKEQIPLTYMCIYNILYL